jgi:hypothetical protein
MDNQLVCSESWSELFADRAKAFVLCNGGSPELADKFEQFCIAEESKDYSVWSQEEMDHINGLWSVCDATYPYIVDQLARMLKQSPIVG